MSGLRFWTALLGVAVLGGALYAIWTREAGDRPPERVLTPPGPEKLTRPPLPPPVQPPPAGRAGKTAGSASAPAPAKETAESPRDGVDQELVIGHLKEAFETRLPDHALTDEEYAQLADAVLRIRAARLALSNLPASAENAREMEKLREELTQALTDFQYVSNMTPGEFTALAEPDLRPVQEGLTDDQEAPREKDEPVHEYLDEFAPPE